MAWGQGGAALGGRAGGPSVLSLFPGGRRSQSSGSAPPPRHRLSHRDACEAWLHCPCPYKATPEPPPPRPGHASPPRSLSSRQWDTDVLTTVEAPNWAKRSMVSERVAPRMAGLTSETVTVWMGQSEGSGDGRLRGAWGPVSLPGSQREVGIRVTSRPAEGCPHPEAEWGQCNPGPLPAGGGPDNLLCFPGAWFPRLQMR